MAVARLDGMNLNTCTDGGGEALENVTTVELAGFKQVTGGWFLSWGDKDVGFELEITPEKTVFHGSDI